MAPVGAEKAEDKSTGEVVTDLWGLIRDYAKQETIDPLKTIGRFLLWGVIGSVLLSLGVIFGVLAVLRGLQTETGSGLTGSWSWVPYAVSVAVTSLVVLLAVRAITKPNRTSEAGS
ncbi:hypothetical protein BH23ACT2_BH23ACT2_07900 [soil metagenome]